MKWEKEFLYCTKVQFCRSTLKLCGIDCITFIVIWVTQFRLLIFELLLFLNLFRFYHVNCKMDYAICHKCKRCKSALEYPTPPSPSALYIKKQINSSSRWDESLSLKLWFLASCCKSFSNSGGLSNVESLL